MMCEFVFMSYYMIKQLTAWERHGSKNMDMDLEL